MYSGKFQLWKWTNSNNFLAKPSLKLTSTPCQNRGNSRCTMRIDCRASPINGQLTAFQNWRKTLRSGTCASRHPVNFISSSVPGAPPYLSLSQTRVCRDSSKKSSGREKDQRPPFWRLPSKWRLWKQPRSEFGSSEFQNKDRRVEKYKKKKKNPTRQPFHCEAKGQLVDDWEPWPKLSTAGRLVHSAPSLIPCMKWVTLS